MEIKRSGAQPSGRGPAEYFTGTVHIDPLFEAPDPARVRGASVTFEPGARTRLAHASAGPDADRDRWARMGAALGRPDRGDPAGRRGLVRARREALARGDAETAMTHIAVQEALDGSAVAWLEHVSDEQYER